MIIFLSIWRLMPGPSLAGPSQGSESVFPIDFKRAYTFCLRGRDTDGRDTSGNRRARWRAGSTPRAARATLHRRRATVRKMQRARDDTQICHGSSGTEETPSIENHWVQSRSELQLDVLPKESRLVRLVERRIYFPEGKP